MKTKSKRIRLHTYDQSKHKNKNSMQFSVPVEWLENIIEHDNIDNFLDTYTWDESFEIKRQAKEEGVFKYVND